MGDDPGDEGSGKKAPPRRGSLRHDARGNAVWEWAVDSGRHLIASTSLLLKRLDVPGLKLEEDEERDATKPGAQSGAKSAPQERSAGGGYDPYSHKRVASKPAPRSSAVRAATPTGAPLRKPAAAPATRRSWWRRLFRKTD
jgi:hypothetical protein